MERDPIDSLFNRALLNRIRNKKHLPPVGQETARVLIQIGKTIPKRYPIFKATARKELEADESAKRITTGIGKFELQ